MAFTPATIMIHTQRCVIAIRIAGGGVVLRTVVGAVCVALQNSGRWWWLCFGSTPSRQITMIDNEVNGANDSGHNGTPTKQFAWIIVQANDQDTDSLAQAQEGDDRDGLCGGGQASWPQMTHGQHQCDESQRQCDRLYECGQHDVPSILDLRQTDKTQNVDGKGNDQYIRMTTVVTNEFGFP